jgi:hypothetical protein
MYSPSQTDVPMPKVRPLLKHRSDCPGCAEAWLMYNADRTNDHRSAVFTRASYLGMAYILPRVFGDSQRSLPGVVALIALPTLLLPAVGTRTEESPLDQRI